jgi:hypothetical protein
VLHLPVLARLLQATKRPHCTFGFSLLFYMSFSSLYKIMVW